MTPKLMTIVLEDCLQRLAQGETIEACLERYPEQAASLQPLLAAALRLEQGTQLQPSAVFRARTRSRLVAHMAAHPRGTGIKPAPRLSPFSRLALGMSALLLGLTLTGTALAQAALPGQALYPWKLTSEQVWRAVSPDQAGVDLVLVGRRADEMLALSGNASAQAIAITGYQKSMGDLAQDKNPTDQVRIQTQLKNVQDKLDSAGIRIQPAGPASPAGGSDKSPFSPGEQLPGGATPESPGLKFTSLFGA